MRTIRNNSTIRILQAALCLCLSQHLAAQEAEQPTLTDVVQQVSSTPGTLTASDSPPLDGFADKIPIQAFAAQVPLRLEQELSSASAHKGDRIRLTTLKSLSVDGNVVAPAGTAFFTTVSQVRSKTHYRSGEVKLSDATLDLGNGKRLRLAESDPKNRLTAKDIPGTIAFIIVGAATLVPITVALLPVQLPYLLVHKIHEDRLARTAHAAKPETVDKHLAEGEVFIYYTDRNTVTQ